MRHGALGHEPQQDIGEDPKRHSENHSEKHKNTERDALTRTARIDCIGQNQYQNGRVIIEIH